MFARQASPTTGDQETGSGNWRQPETAPVRMRIAEVRPRSDGTATALWALLALLLAGVLIIVGYLWLTNSTTPSNGALAAAMAADDDGDGWTMERESNARTNPFNPDTDGDGLGDGTDPNPLVAAIVNPGDPAGPPVFYDGDNVPDDGTDKCPNEDETVNGYLDEDGCPDQVPGDGKIDPTGSCDFAIANAEGYPGPTTAEAKDDTGVDLQRLGTECAAFVWRGVPHSTMAWCPDNYICTFTLVNGRVRVYLGNGQEKNITAATWRYIDVYPDGDAVYRPCELLAKEYGFGVNEIPDFRTLLARDSNFSCNGVTAAAENSEGELGSDPVNVNRDCPADANAVVKLLGGTSSAGRWEMIGPKQWKYGPNAPAVTLHASRGTIDWWDGSKVRNTRNAPNVTEATYNCPA